MRSWSTARIVNTTSRKRRGTDPKAATLRVSHLIILALAVALPATSLRAAEKYEMKFQFDQNGTPSMHTYVLKWNGPDSNLQSIDVLVSDTQEVIQTIAIPQDQVHLIWKELTDKPQETKDKFIDSLDFNFDKYSDLRLTKQWPYKVGQKFYLVYLFNEEKNRYEFNAEISKLEGPTPNPKTRRIETTDLGGFGGGEYVKRAYSINPKGKLRVQTKITQTVSDKMRLTFLREVRVRIAGELQRVCKIAIPAEGKPNTLWGRRFTCRKFLTKE